MPIPARINPAPPMAAIFIMRKLTIPSPWPDLAMAFSTTYPSAAPKNTYADQGNSGKRDPVRMLK